MTANNYVIRHLAAALMLASCTGGGALHAAELGVRVSALHADTNLHALGLIAHWPLSQGYFVQATLDRQTFEHTAGSPRLPPVAVQSVVAGAAIGREYRRDWAVTSWFWSWGLAAGFPAIGRGAGNVSRDNFSAATEIHVTGALGLSRQVSEHWSLTGAARFERHFIDWRRTDDAGTQLERLRTLTTSGVSLSLNYRF